MYIFSRGYVETFLGSHGEDSEQAISCNTRIASKLLEKREVTQIHEDR